MGKQKLHDACKNNNLEEVKSLINKKYNVNFKDKEGKTPLSIAFELDHTSIVNTLIAAGAISETEHYTITNNSEENNRTYQHLF